MESGSTSFAMAQGLGDGPQVPDCGTAMLKGTVLCLSLLTQTRDQVVG